MLKGYLERQKATPRGPDKASICDKLGVRTCCLNLLCKIETLIRHSPYERASDSHLYFNPHDEAELPPNPSSWTEFSHTTGCSV